jgi:hypothetical protein
MTLAAVKMSRIGDGSSRFRPGVERDLFAPLVEEAQQPRLAPHPHLATDVFRRHRVVGPFELDVPVPMHRALGLLENGEHHGRKHPQRGLFHLREHLANLLARRAMNAGVGHRSFPLGQISVLPRQPRKAPSLDRVVLRILHSGLHLALVPGHGGLGGQNHGAVVPGKLLQLGIDLRVMPIGPDHARLQVVDLMFPATICASAVVSA